MKLDAPRLNPWWKSLGFWMGLLVAGFVVWAWIDSMDGDSEIYGESLIESMTFASEFGALRYSRVQRLYEGWDLSMAARREVLDWQWDRVKYGLAPGELPIDREWFLRPVWRSEVSRYGERSDEVVLPFWLVLSTWLVVWMGLLAAWRRWQWRRLRAAGVVESNP